MKPTIEALWNGDIAPAEHCGSHDPAVNKLLGLMERNRENLLGGLTPAQGELFQKYLDASEEYLFRMMELSFDEGFCPGIRLTAEGLI